LALNNITYREYYPSFTWFSMNFVWSATALMAIALVGKYLLPKVSTGKVVGGSLIGSCIFFLVSNFGVWQSDLIYTHNMSGLATCYAQGIPFFLNTVVGDLFFCGLLFGVFELASRRFSSLAVN
jgi:hypothetical protein